jgi:hypothetical protein
MVFDIREMVYSRLTDRRPLNLTFNPFIFIVSLGDFVRNLLILLNPT